MQSICMHSMHTQSTHRRCGNSARVPAGFLVVAPINAGRRETAHCCCESACDVLTMLGSSCSHEQASGAAQNRSECHIQHTTDLSHQVSFNMRSNSSVRSFLDRQRSSGRSSRRLHHRFDEDEQIMHQNRSTDSKMLNYSHLCMTPGLCHVM